MPRGINDNALSVMTIARCQSRIAATMPGGKAKRSSCQRGPWSVESGLGVVEDICLKRVFVSLTRGSYSLANKAKVCRKFSPAPKIVTCTQKGLIVRELKSLNPAYRLWLLKLHTNTKHVEAFHLPLWSCNEQSRCLSN
jgi:hypothetical protein